MSFMNLLSTVRSFFVAKKRVFLDYASTTPIDREVSAEMRFFEHTFSNPSALYTEALISKEHISSAREKIAHLLHGQSEEIVFTSGGTEGNNIALLGVFEHFKRTGMRPHVVTTTIEHPAILEVCTEIEKRGGRVTYVPVDDQGIIILPALREALTEDTVLVSVMYANNEVGTIQPIREVVKIVKEFRKKQNTAWPYVHTDACHAFLYCDIHTTSLGVDLVTLDGLKMYGPRSMGLLFVRHGTPVHPVIFGGGQERGIRSGTENLTGIMGLAKACEVASRYRETEVARLTALRDKTIKRIMEMFPTATLNGSATDRLPNNINMCFPGLNAEFAVISLDLLGVCLSYSSSCRTLKEDSSSYVISALQKPECRESSLRITFGRETTEKDVHRLLAGLKKVVQ